MDSSFSVNEINLLLVWLGRQKNLFPISWQYWASQFPIVGEPGQSLVVLSNGKSVYYELLWDAVDSPAHRYLRSVRLYQLQTSDSVHVNPKIINVYCHSAASGWL